MIAGFILGNSSSSSDIIIRGLGPSLSGMGVSNALPDPALELRDSNGSLLYSNNDWQDVPAQAVAITAAGLAPTNTKEAAISRTLSPGAYTVLLRDQNGATGNGLVEIYQVASPGP